MAGRRKRSSPFDGGQKLALNRPCPAASVMAPDGNARGTQFLGIRWLPQRHGPELGGGERMTSDQRRGSGLSSIGWHEQLLGIYCLGAAALGRISKNRARSQASAAVPQAFLTIQVPTGSRRRRTSA
ncbi:hypothetical protein DC522_25465 [Microvirga sp. KLBC 81]|nr:hypothetical protein DC522_25465 [Microvirga sp. KLBC 81]